MKKAEVIQLISPYGTHSPRVSLNSKMFVRTGAVLFGVVGLLLLLCAVPTDCASLLGSADFTFLGSYTVSNNVLEGLTFGRGLTFRYVGGRIRMIVMGYDHTTGLTLGEFELPDNFSTTI